MRVGDVSFGNFCIVGDGVFVNLDVGWEGCVFGVEFGVG